MTETRRAERPAPTSPPAGLRWPGRRDEVSGDGHHDTDRQVEPKRAEQQSDDNLEQLSERPVRRPNEARRFA